MARVTIDVTCRMRWWVMTYVRALGAFAMMTGLELDGDKLASLLSRRGFKVSFTERVHQS